MSCMIVVRGGGGVVMVVLAMVVGIHSHGLVSHSAGGNGSSCSSHNNGCSRS